MDLPGSTISPRWTKHSASDYKSTPQYLLQPDKPSLNRLKQSSCSDLPLWSRALTLATSGRPGILQLSRLFKCWKKVLLLCSLEVLVGRAGWDTGQKEVLLPKLELMNRFELTIFFVVDDCQLRQFNTETNVSPGKTRKRWSWQGRNTWKGRLPLKNGIPSRLSVGRSANGKIDINNFIPTFQPHKFNNEVYGLSMFVLHGQEDRKEVDNKENRGVELPGTKVVKAGLQELEKKLDRAAPSKHQLKLSTTLQVSSYIQGGYFDWSGSALEMTKCQTLRKFWYLELFWRDLHVIWHLDIFRADQLKKPPCSYDCTLQMNIFVTKGTSDLIED